MCGICGKFNVASGDPVPPELIKRMADVLRHRGPDGEGYYVHKNIGLGHRRLKIIDLETGQQPMFNEDGSLVVIFNGEIYNFMELRRELQASGHHFRTKSDTEVLLHGYEEWGRLLQRLRGMFAFAIWDHHKRELFFGAGSHRHQTALLLLGWQNTAVRFGDQGHSGRYGSAAGC